MLHLRRNDGISGDGYESRDDTGFESSDGVHGDGDSGGVHGDGDGDSGGDSAYRIMIDDESLR
jgi:hypothetical protein